MNRLLKLLIKTYVVIKVAPIIINGVAYIADGAINGISNKIAKDIVHVIYDGEKDKSRSLRNRRYSSYKAYKKDRDEKA